MTTKTNYDVGYCKPPRYAQWKKGQSGNPGGRAKRPANLGALVSALLGKRVVVRKGKTTARMTRLEHLLTRLIEKAIAGDPRLMKMALDEVRRDEARAANDASGDASGDAIGPADAEVMEALIARLTRDARLRVAGESGSGSG
jgi:hypothetical protein